MTSGQDSASLLAIIKRLYSKILVLRTESRTKSGHSNHTNASSNNIALSLSEYVDKLAADAINHPSDNTYLHGTKPESHSHDYPTISNQKKSSRTEPGELTRHLKNSHRYTGAIPEMGKKLIQTTWEHFHTSIRLARQGDAQKARLHVQLMNSALNEAAHYLSEIEYSRFSKEVMKALKEINDQT